MAVGLRQILLILQLRMTCILDSEIQNLLTLTKIRLVTDENAYGAFKKLFYAAVQLRRFDIENNILQLGFLFSGEENDLLLRIQCCLAECPLKVVIDSKGQIRREDIDWDETFFSSYVQVAEDLPLNCWKDKTKVICESVFDIWKQLISEGIVRMDL